MIYQSHHRWEACLCDCSSRQTELRCSTERSVYALSCGTVSLVEFTVNHIAFIARFSSLSSVGSIHFKLVHIRILSLLYTRTWIHIVQERGKSSRHFCRFCTSFVIAWALLQYKTVSLLQTVLTVLRLNVSVCLCYYTQRSLLLMTFNPSDGPEIP